MESENPFAGCEFISDHKQYEHEDFGTEKELCDFIEVKAKIFASEVLGVEYKSYIREYYISGDSRINKNKKGRVDFVFHSDKGDIYVECKKPTHSYSESVNAISQLLAYSCLADTFKRQLYRMVLVTTRYNPMLLKVIKKFNLPIEIYVLSKSNVMKLIVGGCHG
jgi:hypothetical protein